MATRDRVSGDERALKDILYDREDALHTGTEMVKINAKMHELAAKCNDPYILEILAVYADRADTLDLIFKKASVGNYGKGAIYVIDNVSNNTCASPHTLDSIAKLDDHLFAAAKRGVIENHSTYISTLDYLSENSTPKIKRAAKRELKRRAGDHRMFHILRH